MNRLPADQEKKIYILIKQANHNLLIELTNRFDIREVTARKHRVSAGIGIKNIKKVVHNHMGFTDNGLRKIFFIPVFYYSISMRHLISRHKNRLLANIASGSNQIKPTIKPNIQDKNKGLIGYEK